MLRKLFFILIIAIPFFVDAQEDGEEDEYTILQTPEEKQRKKELAEEKKYLNFQKSFFSALQQKAKEDYSKAIELLEKCNEIFPNDAGMNFEFAKNYYHLKDYENAIFFSHKVLQEKPNNIYVFEHLKRIYRKQHDFDNAIDMQKKIIAINPKKKSDLIILYLSNRQREEAKNLFLELEQKRLPINNEKYYRRVLFPKKTTPKPTIVKQPNITDNGIKALQKSFNKNKDYQTLKTLLLAEEKSNDYQSILIDSDKGLELFPAQPFLYLTQGKAANQLAKYAKAIEVLQAGLDFIIDDNQLEKEFYLQLQKSHLGLGNTKEANRFLEKATKLK